MKQIILTSGDYGITITTPIKRDGTIFDLTEKTILLDIVRPDGTTVIDKTPLITDALNGIVEFILTADITNVAGTYKLYYSVTDGTSKITAQEVITYTVLPKDGGVLDDIQ